MVTLGNHYRCIPLPGVTKLPSGLDLPDAPVPGDLIVLDRGPGKLLGTGSTWPMQAEPEDRVVVQPMHMRPWTDECFVRDEDLVAVLPGPGPEWGELRPANDWVLLEYERRPEQVSGGGVVVSIQSAYGGGARDLERGERLYREFMERGHRLLQMGLLREERVDAMRKWMRDLPACDVEALQAAHTRRGDTDWEYQKPISSAEPYYWGRFIAQGPGRVGEDGRRITHPLPLQPGDRVRYSPGDRVELSDGQRLLYALRPSDLDFAVT